MGSFIANRICPVQETTIRGCSASLLYNAPAPDGASRNLAALNQWLAVKSDAWIPIDGPESM